MNEQSRIEATSLAHLLEVRFRDFDPPIALSVEGEEVRGECVANRNHVACSVYCSESEIVEYHTEYNHGDLVVAFGQTTSQDDTVAAIEQFLTGVSLDRIYDQFDFMDNELRVLTRIRESISETSCRFDPVVLNLRLTPSLTAATPDRSCHIAYYYGDKDYPKAKFYWGEAELFQVIVRDVDYLVRIVVQWVCLTSMPSKMRELFPKLDIRELADYYEAGTPVLGEFKTSWDAVESWFSPEEAESAYKPGQHRFVTALRALGVDVSLRAGISAASVVLSRSRHHGLRNEQPSLQFRFIQNRIEMYEDLDFPSPPHEESFDRVELYPEMVDAVRRLEKVPID